jgi:hypothetical protein
MNTHKATGWTREYLGDGTGRIRITPTDGSGERLVRFLGPNEYAGDPGDEQAKLGEDRCVLLSGPALPDWAAAWLTRAAAHTRRRAREAFQAAIDDADWNECRRDSDDY